MNANALTLDHETATEIEPRREIADAPSMAVTPMAMIDRALSSGAAPETLEKLLALQERWEAGQARKAFDEAMAAAKAEIPTIRKNRTVGYEHKDGGGKTSYQHEDLGEIARVVTPILSKHGLSYRYRTTSNINEPITVTCIISHRLGHSEENTLTAGADNSGKKNSIQAVGSTITYLQRYTLKAALGLAAAQDDDGVHADDGELISIEQINALSELAAEVGADIVKFCQYAGVESLSEIREKDYGKALSALEAKRAKK
jgi:hypothetical protein